MTTAVQKPENATSFEFLARTWKAGSADLTFTYRVHFQGADPLDFTETITLSKLVSSSALPQAFVEAMLEDLHLILGISYYKLFIPPEFLMDTKLTSEQAEFWNTVYKKGLGEFLYRNNLAPSAIAEFTPTDASQSGWGRVPVSIPADPRKVLVGIGGGKDSIVALELLKDYDRTGYVLATGTPHQLNRDVADVADVPLSITSRKIDEKVLAGVEGAYSGHIPISAIYAFVGILEAAIQGDAYIVVANEFSSNFGNLVHEGNEVNHKWSGSAEFEALFQEYVRKNLTPSVRYFSLTRPFYELRVVKLFAELGRDYFSIFSSCNRNFAHADTLHGARWCGECPKCAFTFLMLAAFLPKDAVIGIFKKNLLGDEALIPTYRDLLGLGDMKPFDCVGTFDESKVALKMAAQNGWGDARVIEEFLSQIGDVETKQKEVFRAQRAPTVPTRFRMKGMGSALILGYGREGQASEHYLKTKYPQVKIGIADQKDDPEYLAKQEEYDIVIKTPVIPLEKVTRQYTTATHFFFAEVPRSQIIGVTGSKGKSTTSTLIYEMLQAGGKKARLLGNIGLPAIEEIRMNPSEPDELFVFELSSYQLEDLDLSPHIAVVTSLFPEHLDHHGSMEAYFEAKRNIVRFQEAGDVLVHADGYPLLSEWAKVGIGTELVPEALSFAVENKSLRGDHNVSNVTLAYEVAKQFGVGSEEAERAVKAFVGLPHRLQYLGNFKGIEFYDDSISTIPDSTIAGIRAFQNVHTIILGGEDRGLDFTALEKELREQGVKTVILFPETGERMLASEDGFSVLHTKDMEEAVQFAYAHTPEGGVVLLSPASPSYNLFVNFEDRGQQFIEAVKKYG